MNQEDVIELGKHIAACPYCQKNTTYLNILRQIYKGEKQWELDKELFLAFVYAEIDVEECPHLNEIEQSIFSQTSKSIYRDIILGNKSTEEMKQDFDKIQYIIKELG